MGGFDVTVELDKLKFIAEESFCNTKVYLVSKDTGARVSFKFNEDGYSSHVDILVKLEHDLEYNWIGSVSPREFKSGVFTFHYGLLWT